MSIDMDRYRLNCPGSGFCFASRQRTVYMMPSAQERSAQQPMRAPDQTPFIAVVEYLPIAVESRYTPLAAGLTRRLPIDGARSLLGRWPDPAVLRLCQRLYGNGPSLLLVILNFILWRPSQLALISVLFRHCFRQASRFRSEIWVTVRWCPRCGPGSPLVVGGQQEDKLVCNSWCDRTDAPESFRLLNSGAARLL